MKIYIEFVVNSSTLDIFYKIRKLSQYKYKSYATKMAAYSETFYRTRVCSSRLYILSKLYQHLDANRKSFHSTPDADMRPDQTQLSERPRRAVKVLPTSTFRDACEILLCFALKLGLR